MMRRVAVGGAVVAAAVWAGLAAAFTNAWEPRVLHPAGRAHEGPVQFAWSGARLRIYGPGIVAGEMRLKVWGEGGGNGQVLLCMDLRATDPHPRPRQLTLRDARLVPLETLYSGPLPKRRAARARRVKFRFRACLPQPLRAHDLWLVALQKCCPAAAADYLRGRSYPAKEYLVARRFARLFLWDAANGYTLPYICGNPGYPELFTPRFGKSQP